MSAETPRYNLWLDCEFTGLSLQEDLLLEVGAVVTEGLFEEINSYTTVISHNPLSVVSRMAQDEWWPSRPVHRDAMLDEVERSAKTLEIVDQELATFAAQYFAASIIPVGSSPSIDRRFISRDLPQFNSLLHYRTIDVSSFKEVAKQLGVEEYKKIEQHRARADILESIQELKYLMIQLGAPAVRSLMQDKS